MSDEGPEVHGLMPSRGPSLDNAWDSLTDTLKQKLMELDVQQRHLREKAAASTRRLQRTGLAMSWICAVAAWGLYSEPLIIRLFPCVVFLVIPVVSLAGMVTSRRAMEKLMAEAVAKELMGEDHAE